MEVTLLVGRKQLEFLIVAFVLPVIHVVSTHYCTTFGAMMDKTLPANKISLFPQYSCSNLTTPLVIFPNILN